MKIKIRRVKNETNLDDECHLCELNTSGFGCSDCNDDEYFVFAEKLEFEIVDGETLENICPDCGSKTPERWSGIKCDQCGYWFCY